MTARPDINPNPQFDPQAQPGSQAQPGLQPQLSSEPRPIPQFNSKRAAAGAVWLVFLASPLFSIFAANLTVPARIASVMIVVVFGVIYTVAHGYTDEIAARPAVHVLAVWLFPLLVLTAALSALIGPWAASLLPFLTALASSLIRVRVSIAVNIVMLAAYAAYTLWVGNAKATIFMAMIAAITFAVGFQVSTMRVHEDRTQLAAELDLAHQRETIYRDVHDLLGHSLTVINVKSSLAHKLIERDPQRAAEQLAEITELSRTSLEDVRRAVRNSHSPSLEHELRAAERALESADIVAHVKADPSSDSAVFAWVLREAVTNVIRHSGATECTITVTPAALVVADNGVGLPAGVELRGISQRVKAAGARLTVGPCTSSDAEAGTVGAPADTAATRAATGTAPAAATTPGTRIEVTR